MLGPDGFIGFYPCRDLRRATLFYGRLGLEVARDQGSCVIFRVAAGAYLGFCEHDRSSPEHPGLIVTLLVDDVDAAYKQLSAVGAPTEGLPRVNERFGIYHFFARDPEGYRLEVQRFLDPLG